MCWDILGTSLKLRHPALEPDVLMMGSSFIQVHPLFSERGRERERQLGRMLQTVGQTVAATGAASVKLG